MIHTEYTPASNQGQDNDIPGYRHKHGVGIPVGLGVEARVRPAPDSRTLEPGGKVTSGDERYLAKVA